MPIQVTCPDCQYHFHVADEFAGRMGRCPVCGEVIRVPDPHAGEPGHPDPDPHPYGLPPAFEDLPAPSARSPAAAPAGPDYRPRDRAERRRERQFDPHARAARWMNVSHGLRNLMVATVLLVGDYVAILVFGLTDIAQGMPPNQIARKQALYIATALVCAISLILWGMGRAGCGRVPYVPAQRVAFPAGVIAALSAVGGLIGLGGVVVGAIMLMQQNQFGLQISLLFQFALFPAAVGFLLAEGLGLASQVRMAAGLRDSAFGTASRVQLVVFLGMSLLSCCLTCGVAVAFEQADQQMQQQQNGANGNEEDAQPDRKDRQPAPDKKGAPPLPGKKGATAAKKDERGPDKKVPEQPAAGGKKGEEPDQKKDGPGDQPAAGAAQAPAQPPPPPDPAVLAGYLVCCLVLALAAAGTGLICFHLGRRAVHREVARLVRDPHDAELSHDPHY